MDSCRNMVVGEGGRNLSISSNDNGTTTTTTSNHSVAVPLIMRHQNRGSGLWLYRHWVVQRGFSVPAKRTDGRRTSAQAVR